MNKTPLVTMERMDGIAHIRLNRPDKHNAINDDLLLQLEALFDPVDEGIRVVLLTGSGDNFCAGLDLAEHQAREPFDVVRHSRLWHRVFGKIHEAGVPVVAVLKGAVIGGGLELAACAHVRVAEMTTYFRLPEGRHGIFTGGGASVRVANVIGSGRMTEMMLTGRTLDATEGERLGLAHYLTGEGEGEAKARELAESIARNSPLSNWAMVTAVARIDSMSMDDGLFTESLVAGMTQTHPDVQTRIGQFLNRKKDS
ncbi:crotonase/enoyl-CoA hydratase family protein [Saccharospirillum salsuginis]|uniref:Enoyl-CoA hydratase n=1 Tax=Saccharospirillum salsuginis TaxID=418750 RepID=A0A918KQA8_9GAMM|nr:crotonase/enoyl-CoA hydratase family protein [Saccharospirillum salsuginis]GGX72090.1 enoyl-CoA hydratase [Saccharospirillum salsuginis]